MNSIVSGSDAQRKSKVSFCLQSDQGDDLRGYKTTASTTSKCAVPVSRSAAASVTPVIVTCDEAVMSSTTSLPPLTTVSNSNFKVADIPCAGMPADSSDISMLCAELFVANNASFCDQLLGSCPVPHEQPETLIPVLGDSSFNSKQDIPEPITDFAFDDFVEFDFF